MNILRYFFPKDPYLLTGKDAKRFEENMKNAKFDKEGYEQAKKAWELMRFGDK